MKENEKIEECLPEDDQTEDLHPFEQDLDVYPLREPSDDPRWALRTVWTWVSIAIFLLIFIIVLLVLGLWFD